MQLVPDQDPERITGVTADFLHSLAPDTVEVETVTGHTVGPVLVPRQGRFVDAALRALEEGYGNKPVLVRDGASVPALGTLQEELEVPCLLLALRLPDDRAHAPKERFRLEDFYRGMVTTGILLEEIGERNARSSRARTSPDRPV